MLTACKRIDFGRWPGPAGRPTHSDGRKQQSLARSNDRSVQMVRGFHGSDSGPRIRLGIVAAGDPPQRLAGLNYYGWPAGASISQNNLRHYRPSEHGQDRDFEK